MIDVTCNLDHFLDSREHELKLVSKFGFAIGGSRKKCNKRRTKKGAKHDVNVSLIVWQQIGSQLSHSSDKFSLPGSRKSGLKMSQRVIRCSNRQDCQHCDAQCSTVHAHRAGSRHSPTGLSIIESQRRRFLTLSN